ncbi:MAG: alpha/beta hydrolase, partial [Pseudomonadota bacterium]
MIAAGGGNISTVTLDGTKTAGFEMPDISANGISLHYESIGCETDPPILLVMGLAVQMILWPDAFCRMLADKGFRVIRFDNRDVGLSTQLNHLGKPNIPVEYVKFMLRLPIKARYRIDDMAADTTALMAVLQLPRVHIVGASMGGMIAQNLAASVPDRVASLTSIMSTTGRRSLPKASWRAMKAILTPPAKRGDIEGSIQRMMKVVRAIGSRTHPMNEIKLREFCEQHVLRANNPDGAARQMMAIAASDDRTHIVRQIKVPTLVIHGDEDELIPVAAGLETARVIREGGGQASTLILEGMGHDLPEIFWPRLA